MIKQIIEILQMSDYYGESETIDIAKGKYALPHTLSEAIKLIKRNFYSK